MLSFKEHIIESESPIHDHDCPNCSFVGNDSPVKPNEKGNIVDMYIHNDGKEKTLLRRWSSQPEHHSSLRADRVSGSDSKWINVIKAAKKKGL